MCTGGHARAPWREGPLHASPQQDLSSMVYGGEHASTASSHEGQGADAATGASRRGELILRTTV